MPRAPHVRVVSMLPLVLLALDGCGRGQAVPEKVPTPVKVRVVDRQPVQAGARYSGTIEPATRVEVSFKVSGYIDSIAEVAGADGTRHVLQEGDWIKKGAMLAQVRRSDYLQKVAAAKASLAEATAGQRLATAEADRAERLMKSEAIARSQLESATARRDSAAAQLSAASARVGEAQLALKDCTLFAPIDGVVLKRRVEVGTLISPGTPGFTLAETRTVKVVFGAPDALVEKLRIGSPLSITVETIAGERTGTVTRIAPSADQKSRVFNVEATLDNSKGELKVGMISSLKVPDGALQESAVALPLTAVVRPPGDPRGFAAYVVEAKGDLQVARLREVVLGEVIGNSVIVQKGLSPGDQVVSMGASLLRDGDAVRVIPQGP